MGFGLPLWHVLFNHPDALLASIELFPRVFRHIQDRLACSLDWCSTFLGCQHSLVV